MRKQMLIAALLAASVNTASAVQVPFTFYNYLGTPGNVFLGTAPIVVGPAISTDGNSAQWTTDLTGIQQVGLQVSPTDVEVCYVTNGVLTLDSSLYTGDSVTILYGQPHMPSGIECGCYGSACSLG